MVIPPLPVQAAQSVTVSDLKTLRQLAESGQLKTWQAGALLDVVVSRREGGLLMVDTGKGFIGLPVPEAQGFKPGTALQLQVLALAPLQVQLRPAPPTAAAGNPAPLPTKTLLAALLNPGTTSQLPTAAGSVITPGPSMPGPSIPALISTPEATEADPIANLARAFSARLAPLLSSPGPEQLRDLPARLSEWLSRQAPAITDELIATTNTNTNLRPTAAEWARLGSALLGQWPNTEQASEPDELSQLLRQALFGEPSATAGAAAKPQSDWLGSLARLLFAQPAPLATAPQPAANTPTANPAANASAPAQDGKDENALSALLTAPLPDELVEELANVLGRQQQHWLSNLQADPRQQPLYAELLLRHGERLDPFELSVREEEHSSGNEAGETRHHVVRLRFDLPGLGSCQFLLDLNADDLQLHFYSEHADTVALFDQHLDELAGTLAADAIHLSTVQSHRVEQLPHLQQNKESGFHVRV